MSANEPSQPDLKQSATASVPLVLTGEERQWLDQHKNIRIAYDGSLPPYSFVNDEGNIDGVAVEIMNLLSQRLGIHFTVYPDYNWTSLYKAAAKRKVDAVATMVNRPDRATWFEFTKPYLTKSLVIVTRTGNSSIVNREDIADRTVAVVKGYQYADQLTNEFPAVKLIKVENMLDGLKSVENGQAEAAIIFLGTVNYLQTKHSLNNLRIASFYDRNSANESIAVRKDWPLLLSVMQKGLDSLTEQEVQKIFAKWVIGASPSGEIQAAQPKPAPPAEPVPPPQPEPKNDPATQPAQVSPPSAPVQAAEPAETEAAETSFTAIFIAVIAVLFLLWVFILRKRKRRKPRHKTKNEMMSSFRNLQSVQNEALHRTIEPSSVANRPEELQKAPRPASQEKYGVNPEILSFHRDCEGIIISVSPNITTILGYSETDFITNFRGYLTASPANSAFDEQANLTLQGQPNQPYEIEICDSAKDVHWFRVTDTPVYDGMGRLTGLDSLAADITAEKLYEKISIKSQQEADAIPDQLQILYSQLRTAIHNASQNHQSFILIYVMLDRLRSMDGEVADSEEHDVLDEASRRLKATLRDSDQVLQFDINKFALILPDSNADMISLLIEKLRKILQVPYLIGAHSIVLNANIGIAVYPKNGGDPGDLIREAQILLPEDPAVQADSALPETIEKAITENALELQQDLLAALDECKLSLRASNKQNPNVLNRHSQLSVYYQSVHNSGDYSIGGFEALIRWRHPRLGLLKPIDFVTLVKDIGMADVMTYWIIQQVSFQAALWESQDARPAFFIINLSDLTVSQPLDVDKIRAIITEAGADPSWLLFSVSENEIMNHTSFMTGFLNSLSEAGIGVAVDNFGTNSDFLAQLNSIPAQIIEIDPYFTRDVSANFTNPEIITHTVSLLQDQGRKVIIKEVETEAQLEFLKKTGSDMLQGHLLSRALPSAEAKELIETFPDVAWYFQQK